MEVEAEAPEERERQKERPREGGMSLGKEEGGRRRSKSPAKGISAMVFGLGFNREVGSWKRGERERDNDAEWSVRGRQTMTRRRERGIDTPA